MSNSCFRLVPRLDVKGPNLVKGVHLEGLRVLGKPEEFARLYYEEGADELLYMDAVASLYQRSGIVEVVSRAARSIFIPITVGGGLRTVDDIQQMLRAGADKVAVNTAAVRRPEFVREASRRFGSSTITVSIEAIRHADGRYEAYTDCGREPTGVDPFAWAVQAESLGAGELMITSINREGTGQGLDLELTRRIVESVSIPVIACGGVGTLEDVKAAAVPAGANAVCLASILHYDAVPRLEFDPAKFAAEGNVDFIGRGGRLNRIKPASLPAIRGYLTQEGVPVRASTLELSDV